MDHPTLPTDLTACDREVIHAPGAIQPHGILLAVERDGLRIRHVAGDVERRLGVAEWHGSALSVVIGENLAEKVAGLGELGAAGAFIGQIRAADGELMDVGAHASGAHFLVEIEAAGPDAVSTSVVLDTLAAASGRFEDAASFQALCARAAIEFRAMIGFDRVMVYRFIEGDVGVVLAEDRREDLHSFLNHHFPASDIPRQARALYLRNLIRVIPDAFYTPANLRPEWTAPKALDMSDGSLRSVSPVHLQYLANMGVRASASISIVRDGMLWGLIACHHETPRSLPYAVRAACRTLAGSLSRQITAKEEAEGYRQRFRLREFEDDVVRLLSTEDRISGMSPRHLSEVGRMMGASGVAVLRGGEFAFNGVCPAESEVRDLASWILGRGGDPILATSSLPTLYPPAAAYRQLASGIMAVTLSADEPWLLLWFRAEQIQTVAWAGNPHKSSNPSSDEQLTPRASFAAWKEQVSGRSRDWSLPELQSASRLRMALLDARRTQRVAQLNRQLTNIVRDKDILLKQKEFLISEINHRVQNSLQLVSSFLALQAKGAADAETRAALEEARRRLSAVALVHRRLYRGDQIDIVDAGRYIEELCADTLSFMGPEWAQHLTLDLSPVVVSADVAVPLGLVFTELMINSNKYAYGGAAGPVTVQIMSGPNNIQMVVSDKGVGNPAPRKGFGSRIVDGLVAQLGGSLTYSDNKPGLRITVAIPIQPPERI